jgi:hypothetical protein
VPGRVLLYISIVAADGVIRERLPDETLLVFLSDTHIGGSSGSDIFESAAELTMLLEELHHHEGPVELILAGDFLDLLRMGDPDGDDPMAATLARPEYRELVGLAVGLGPVAARALNGDPQVSGPLSECHRVGGGLGVIGQHPLDPDTMLGEEWHSPPASTPDSRSGILVDHGATSRHT